MNQNSGLRGKIFESINEIMNNDDLFGGDTNQRNSFAQKMVQALSGITSDADIGPIFEEEKRFPALLFPGRSGFSITGCSYFFLRMLL